MRDAVGTAGGEAVRAVTRAAGGEVVGSVAMDTALGAIFG